MSLSSIEQQIITEYGVFVGTVKNNSLLSVGITAVVFWLIGHYL